ncbi:hypothetical protein [uncultured Vibrio sp.]|uniref:hypothetical protein n=1 Tax=uncultured Vibrio sp. TaxID=114054 RepID=UPI0025E036ED|nr:hypothetical protein [uncultured Vibrio sp.]
MTTIAILGIDIGKRSFHVIGRDKHEKQVKKARYSRSKLIEFIANLPPCLIAMEGCAGAHWLGHSCIEEIMSRPLRIESMRACSIM